MGIPILIDQGFKKLQKNFVMLSYSSYDSPFGTFSIILRPQRYVNQLKLIAKLRTKLSLWQISCA